MNIDKKNFEKFLSVCRVAVEYVGSANYQERENHALREVDRCANAVFKNKTDEIVFREDTQQ